MKLYFWVIAVSLFIWSVSGMWAEWYAREGTKAHAENFRGGAKCGVVNVEGIDYVVCTIYGSGVAVCRR